MATFAHALQRAQQVNGVKDMTENLGLVQETILVHGPAWRCSPMTSRKLQTTEISGCGESDRQRATSGYRGDSVKVADQT